MLNTLKVKFLSETAHIPTRANPGDAGLDLYADEDTSLYLNEVRAVSTGIAVEIPDGYVGLIHPRSGLALKHGITVVNAPGTVDSAYRGEVKVILGKIKCESSRDFSIKRGDRIAQLVIQKVELPTVQVVDQLSSSQRGTAGFGSSGR